MLIFLLNNVIIPGELSFKVSLIESVDTLYLPDLRFFLFTKISFAYPVLKFNLFFVLDKLSFFYLKFSLFSFFHRYLLSCAHMKFNLLFPFTKISLVYPVLIWTDPGVETFCVGDRWEEVDKGEKILLKLIMIYGDIWWEEVDKCYYFQLNLVEKCEQAKYNGVEFWCHPNLHYFYWLLQINK